MAERPKSEAPVTPGEAQSEGAASDFNLGRRLKTTNEVRNMQGAIDVALAKFDYRGKAVVDNRGNFPKEIRDSSPTAEGFTYGKDGTLYIDASKHASHADAIFTAFHEAFHRGELGAEAKPYLDALASARKNKTVNAIAESIKERYKRLKGKDIPESLATREALAEVHAANKTRRYDLLAERHGVDVGSLEKAASKGVIRDFIAKTKDFFSKKFRDTMSDREINKFVDDIFQKHSEPINKKFRDLVPEEKNVAHSERGSSPEEDYAAKYAQLRELRNEGHVTHREFWERVKELKAERDGSDLKGLYHHVAPKEVLDEPIMRQEKDGSITPHHDVNSDYEGRRIIPRHDVDRVMLSLRKWDMMNFRQSKKMQWLRKEVFPGKSPRQVMEMVNERRNKEGSVYGAVTHERRDVNPKYVKLGSTERDIAFSEPKDDPKLNTLRELLNSQVKKGKITGMERLERIAKYKASAGKTKTAELNEATTKQQEKTTKEIDSRLANWWRNLPTGGFGTGNVAKSAKLAIDFHRFSVLSGLHVLGKIADAAGLRIARGQIERSIISGLVKLPVLKEIAKQSPLYSKGRQQSIEAQSFEKLGQTILPQLKKAFKTGQLDIDKFRRVTEGMAEDVDEEVRPSRLVLDFPVRLHKTAKTPAQLQTFYVSSGLRYQYDLAQNLANKMSPKDALEATNHPDAQALRDYASYIDSQRDIFMQKNELHSWLEDLLDRGAKSNNPMAKVASFTGQMLLPVRKIGINFLNETGAHIPVLGAGKSVGIVMQTIKQGAKSLSHNEADYLFRNLARQTTGAVASALVYAYFKNNLGGLYVNKDDFKSKEHPHPRDIKTPLGTISGRLLHDPLIDMAHTTATFLHELDKKTKDGEKESIARAGLNTAIGLGADIPTLDLFTRIKDAAQSDYAMKRFGDNMVSSFVIPTGVADIAKVKDSVSNPKVTGRKTTDLKTTLQSGVPLMREKLPAYTD